MLKRLIRRHRCCSESLTLSIIAIVLSVLPLLLTFHGDLAWWLISAAMVLICAIAVVCYVIGLHVRLLGADIRAVAVVIVGAVVHLQIHVAPKCYQLFFAKVATSVEGCDAVVIPIALEAVVGCIRSTIATVSSFPIVFLYFISSILCLFCWFDRVRSN